jgi:hypothetical protein
MDPTQLGCCATEVRPLRASSDSVTRTFPKPSTLRYARPATPTCEGLHVSSYRLSSWGLWSAVGSRRPAHETLDGPVLLEQALTEERFALVERAGALLNCNIDVGSHEHEVASGRWPHR